jgi:hypothetical protein
VKLLSIVYSIEDCSCQCHQFDKITCLLLGVHSFVVENINGRADLIYEAFEVLENAHKIGTCIRSFKEYLTLDIKGDE